MLSNRLGVNLVAQGASRQAGFDDRACTGAAIRTGVGRGAHSVKTLKEHCEAVHIRASPGTCGAKMGLYAALRTGHECCASAMTALLPQKGTPEPVCSLNSSMILRVI